MPDWSRKAGRGGAGERQASRHRARCGAASQTDCGPPTRSCSGAGYRALLPTGPRQGQDPLPRLHQGTWQEKSAGVALPSLPRCNGARPTGPGGLLSQPWSGHAAPSWGSDLLPNGKRPHERREVGARTATHQTLGLAMEPFSLRLPFDQGASGADASIGTRAHQVALRLSCPGDPPQLRGASGRQDVSWPLLQSLSRASPPSLFCALSAGFHWRTAFQGDCKRAASLGERGRLPLGVDSMFAHLGAASTQMSTGEHLPRTRRCKF